MLVPVLAAGFCVQALAAGVPGAMVSDDANLGTPIGPRYRAARCSKPNQNPTVSSKLIGLGDTWLDTDDAARKKLDYERQCYRRAEIIVRSRLRLLQASVGTRRPSNDARGNLGDFGARFRLSRTFPATTLSACRFMAVHW
jgi:hypothetical protein